MLITEDEIKYLPGYATDSTEEEITAYLWQHRMDGKSLLDFARIHCPLLHFSDFENLKPKRLLERLSTSILVNRLLGSSAVILHKETGAPYTSIEGMEISVSHTQGTYAVSLSRKRHGMDIEHWGDKAYKVRSKFISADEEGLFDHLSHYGSTARIATALWSAKEAAYKCFDIPGLDLTEDIRLEPSGRHELAVSIPRFGKKGRIRLYEYPGCILTSCEALL